LPSKSAIEMSAFHKDIEARYCPAAGRGLQSPWPLSPRQGAVHWNPAFILFNCGEKVKG
jgi:hypothetical protein